jgi:hypothetical protein
VNLSTRTWLRASLTDEVFADALGGVGLAVRLIDERVYGPIDPLGPENPIVFAAGPFASTPVPAANKHALATISPLTGLLNEGLSSSHFSAVLRRRGRVDDARDRRRPDSFRERGAVARTVGARDGESVARCLRRPFAARLRDRHRRRARRAFCLGRE